MNHSSFSVAFVVVSMSCMSLVCKQIKRLKVPCSESGLSSRVKNMRFHASLSNIPESSEPSSSSSASEDTTLLRLVASARRMRFIAPDGLTESYCWSRMNDMVMSSRDESSEIRLGDLLIIVNSLISNKKLYPLSLSEVTDLVAIRVKARSRFPNILTLIHYLRFTNYAKCRPQRLDQITRTLAMAPSVKLSELVEVFTLILKSDVLESSSRFEVADLLSAIEHRVSILEENSTESEINRKNVVRLAEFFFNEYKLDGLDRQTRIALLELVSRFMKDRNCAYPQILSGMLELGLQEGISPDDARLIAEAVRDHQLTRWKYVEPLFSGNPEWEDKLSRLSERSGIDLSSPKRFPAADSLFFGPNLDYTSARGITGFYSRVSPDMNGGPVFKKGKFLLYFSSSSGCWEISTDPSREIFRVAFIPGTSSSVPLEAEGWRVFRRKTGSFADTNFKLLKPDDVPTSTEIPKNPPNTSIDTGLVGTVSEVMPDRLRDIEPTSSSESILADWESAAEVSEAKDTKLEELEALVKVLQERLTALEERTVSAPISEKLKDAQRVSERSVQPKTQEESSFSTICGSLLSWLKPEMVQVKQKLLTFDEFREEKLRNERIDRTAKLVARKLRT